MRRAVALGGSFSIDRKSVEDLVIGLKLLVEGYQRPTKLVLQR